MTAYSVPQGTIDAARTILAAGTGANVSQAHEITIRDQDANEEPEKVRVLRLIPLGATIGVAITRANELPEDKDYLFIAAAALGSVLPALGFTFTEGVITYIHAPKDAPR